MQAAIWLVEDAVTGMRVPRHPVTPPQPSAELLAAAAPPDTASVQQAGAVGAAAVPDEGPSTPGRPVLPQDAVTGVKEGGGAVGGEAAAEAAAAPGEVQQQAVQAV